MGEEKIKRSMRILMFARQNVRHSLQTFTRAVSDDLNFLSSIFSPPESTSKHITALWRDFQTDNDGSHFCLCRCVDVLYPYVVRVNQALNWKPQAQASTKRLFLWALVSLSNKCNFLVIVWRRSQEIHKYQLTSTSVIDFDLSWLKLNFLKPFSVGWKIWKENVNSRFISADGCFESEPRYRVFAVTNPTRRQEL